MSELNLMFESCNWISKLLTLAPKFHVFINFTSIKSCCNGCFGQILSNVDGASLNSLNSRTNNIESRTIHQNA